MSVLTETEFHSNLPRPLSLSTAPPPFHHPRKQEEIIWAETVVRLVVSTLCCVYVTTRIMMNEGWEEQMQGWTEGR